jgi:hypothetical protein
MSRKVRRTNLDTVLLQAKKAGWPVKRVIFLADGSFELILADDETGNPPQTPPQDIVL